MGALDRLLNVIKLNDDDFDDDELLDDEDLDEEDDFIEDEMKQKPRRSFLDKFSGRKNTSADRYDPEDDEDESLDELLAETASASGTEKSGRTSSIRATQTPSKVEKSYRSSSSSKITPMRSRKNAGLAAGNMEVCVFRPTSMEGTREIADSLLDNATVILNLEGLDVELAQRIIDFTSGACYSLDGTLQKVSSYIFVLGPANVDITGDLQNIMMGTMPSVRAGY